MSADERWPGRVPLLPDESFSSWFARTAVANGLRPNELFRIVLPGGDRSLRDLDRHADLHLLQHLAEKTGIDAEKLAQATFRRWGGLVFEHDDGLNKLPWLSPSGRIGGKVCYGQQLCPMCLAADAKPYLRLAWRLGFVTVCGLHGNLLLDRCPHCHESFSVLRQVGRTSVHCAGCGRDIRDFAVELPLVDNADLQRDLLDTVRQGWWDMGIYGPVYSFAAFHVFSIIARMLAGGRHAYALRAWVSDHETGLSFPPEIVPRARDGERLNVQARNLLVAMAAWLMGEWPERFVAAARAAKLTGRDIFKHDEGLYPFAFADVVSKRLEASLKRDSREEVASAKMILDREGKPSTRRNLAELIGSRRRVLTLCDKGVVLGKGTVIVGLTDLAYGGTVLDLDGKEADILALLSVARRGLAPAEILAKLAAASRALTEGDVSRAAIALAQTGQPALTDEALAKSLTFAANRLKRGVKPLELLKNVGMVNRNISALPWSKGAEGWNEDDHPREGDGAHYPSRFAPKNGGNQDATAGQPSPLVDPDGTSGRYGDNTKLDTVEDQIKQAVQGKKYVALVGGAMDESIDGPVFKLWQETKKAHPDWDIEYFPNTDADGLKAWIGSHPDSNNVAVIGHSYGGDTAAKVVAEGAKVGALITIDPVSHNTPDYDKVRQNTSDNWINVNANPDREQRGKEKDSGNLIAGLGGAWDLDPKGSSSQFYNANMNHSEVRRVLPGL